MPTLALFAACERSIVEAETGVVSMIALIHAIKVSVPADQPPPVNAVIPKEWTIVTGWDGGEGDDGKEFFQHLEIYLPDGKPFIEKTRTRFTVQQFHRHNLTWKIVGFPIGQKGALTVKVWTELDGRPVTEKFSLSLRVDHEIVAKPK